MSNPESIQPDLRKESSLKLPWEMTREEFLESAKKGRMFMDDSEDVAGVAEGTKPVAVIAYPENTELPATRLLKSPEVAEKTKYRLFTHPGSARRVAIVAPREADLDKLTDTYIGFFYNKEGEQLKLKPNLKETPQSVVEKGKFYGYSMDDINHYLNRNFGYDQVIRESKF